MVLRDKGNRMLQEFWKKLTRDVQSRGEYSQGLRISAFEEKAEEGDLRRKGISPGWGRGGWERVLSHPQKPGFSFWGVRI